jgi:hypothetical protein
VPPPSNCPTPGSTAWVGPPGDCCSPDCSSGSSWASQWAIQATAPRALGALRGQAMPWPWPRCHPRRSVQRAHTSAQAVAGAPLCFVLQSSPGRTTAVGATSLTALWPGPRGDVVHRTPVGIHRPPPLPLLPTAPPHPNHHHPYLNPSLPRSATSPAAPPPPSPTIPTSSPRQQACPSKTPWLQPEHPHAQATKAP